MIKLKLRLPKSVASNPISRLFRPIFEAKRTKGAFGGILSAASFVITLGVYPIVKQSPISALEPITPAATIETMINGPKKTLPQMKTISQGFWAGHPGIDITASLGASIYPVRAGKVVEVSISRYDYGRSVVIEHDDGTTSRYAHLGKIKIDEGEEVGSETVIGEVGITGHTTGPHLHLEIRKNGVALNPAKYLRTVGQQ